MSDEFLRKLYEMSGGEYKIFERYKVGREIGISNSQTDDIIDDLHNMGLIKKIVETKILLTFEGKQEIKKIKIELDSMCWIYNSMSTAVYYLKDCYFL